MGMVMGMVSNQQHQLHADSCISPEMGVCWKSRKPVGLGHPLFFWDRPNIDPTRVDFLFWSFTASHVHSWEPSFEATLSDLATWSCLFVPSNQDSHHEEHLVSDQQTIFETYLKDSPWGKSQEDHTWKSSWSNELIILLPLKIVLQGWATTFSQMGFYQALKQWILIPINSQVVGPASSPVGSWFTPFVKARPCPMPSHWWVLSSSH